MYVMELAMAAAGAAMPNAYPNKPAQLIACSRPRVLVTAFDIATARRQHQR